MIFTRKDKTIAIIPARGGSKRIPRKNIKDFCGQPIMSYSIRAAKNSGLFDEIMVSTDDEEIAAAAKRHGASVPFLRSAAGSSDYATTAEVVLEVVEAYRKAGKEFTYICCIYPTAPFITAEKINTAFQLLNETKMDALIPVVPFSYPPLRGLIVEKGTLCMKWPENETVRSQDLETLYHDCGQFYFVRADALLREQTLFCRKTVPMYLSELEVQDIDSETDWKLAELKYQLLKEKHDDR